MPAARWIAAAHVGVSFGFFPFAAFPAAFLASSSRCLACPRRRRAFFDESLPARSIRVVARSSFFRIAGGIVALLHSRPRRPASIVQRGVVHGAVVVVVVVDEDGVVNVCDAAGRCGSLVGEVVGVVVVVCIWATTLIGDAKSSSPGVPVLAARTVSASEIPGAVSPGGLRPTMRSADPPAAMVAWDGSTLTRKPLSSFAVR